MLLIFVYIPVTGNSTLTMQKSIDSAKMKHFYLIILTFFTLVSFGTTTKVARVIDGDTFETETGEKVRLIGINAPEISDIFGQEAKQHLENLIDGKTIELKADNISNDRDRYSRLLRYVIYNEQDVNKQMITDGFAFAYLKYHFEKSENYRLAQLTASKNNLGIWGNEQKTGIIQQQNEKEDTSYPSSFKKYFIVGVLAILIFLGIYFYFRK